jgi:glycosidase
MKKLHALIFCMALILIGQAGIAQPPEKNTPYIWSDGVTYEIFVRSFYDSNNDGIGDLNGIIDKLDYLHWLGVRSIWLMPINPSPSVHGYDITNYRQVNPEYGTLSNFKKLLDKAHKRNIKVVMDLVVNHTSNKNPWFKKAIADTNSLWYHYYIWTTDTMVVNRDSKHWHYVPSIGEWYYGFFSSHMPDLNYDNPAVRRAIISIGQYWLKMGVDGFRLDAAKLIYPSNEVAKNVQWWTQFRQAMQKVNPRVYLVGEVWDKTPYIASYIKALGSCFDFPLSGAIINSVRSGRSHSLVSHLMRIHQTYNRATDGKYIDAIFLTNHDMERIMSQLKGNVGKARIAASLLLTFPGAPFIYYGEEIGMKGFKKPGQHVREPFIWKKDNYKGKTHWRKPIYSTDQTVVPEKEERKNHYSLLNHYRRLIHFRNQSPILQKGKIDTTGYYQKGIISYYRMLHGDTLLVLQNISNSSVTLKPGSIFKRFNRSRYISLTHNSYNKSNNSSLKISSYGTIILGK